MEPIHILLIVLVYFGILLLVARLTAGNAADSDFFIGSKKSPWFLVAFGMIGTSLSGVTFISVPGVVGNLENPNQQFSYMQMVLGYLLGYFFIATVLMPLYYRLNLTSIYTYLEKRFGPTSYVTGAGFFILSRTLGATFRIFLVTSVMQEFVLGPLGVPYLLTIFATLAMIWIYTYQGGIRTIVYTDTLQTFFMLLAVLLTIIYIAGKMELGLGGMIGEIRASDYGQFFFWDPKEPTYFFKQFFTGAAIATVMTGLDQDMMQKNNSCPNIGDAQKNMASFSIILVFVNLLFVALGALFYIYAGQSGIELPGRTDHVFPALALEQFPLFFGIIFVIGLVAAAFSSADSAITALTTSFCVDILDFENSDKPAAEKKRIRYGVHLGFSLLILLICYTIYATSRNDVLGNLFRVAGYTYGPLLGLYMFGLFTKRSINDRLAPFVCVLSIMICLFFAGYGIVGDLFGVSEAFLNNWENLVVNKLLNGYKIGFEILIYNGILTSLGLWIISRKTGPEARPEL